MSENNAVTSICTENLKVLCKNGSAETEVESTDVSMLTCPDTRTLHILDELNSIYEARCLDIDRLSSGDSQLKCVTYKEWVDILKHFARDLVETLSELEYEACKRIALLEKKLEYEIQFGHETDIDKIKNDLTNLMELIRRAVDDGKWDPTDLKFSTITMSDLFGDKIDQAIQSQHDLKTEITANSEQEIEKTDTDEKVQELSRKFTLQNVEIDQLKSEQKNLRCEIIAKDQEIKQQAEKIKSLENSERIFQPETHLPATADDLVFEKCIEDLKDCLQKKDQELERILAAHECLKKELQNSKKQEIERDKAITSQRALAFEVAEKHDQLLEMRSHVNMLEDSLKKYQKKIQFKDNVIKELRKECKLILKSPGSSQTTLVPFEMQGDGVDEEQFLSPISSPIVDENSDRTYDTLETIVEYKSDKLSYYQGQESEYIKLLKTELDDLIQYQTIRNDAADEQKKMLNEHSVKIKEHIDRLAKRLAIANVKLNYIQNQLLAIFEPNEQNSVFNSESEYAAQGDLEPEFSMIDTVKIRIKSIEQENYDLKNHIEKTRVHVDIKESNAVSETISNEKECNSNVLRKIAQVVINLQGEKKIPVEDLLTSPTSCDDQVHPLLHTIMSLEADIYKNRDTMEALKKNIVRYEGDLENLRSKNGALKHECSAKDNSIAELQRTVEYQARGLEELKEINSELEERIYPLQETVLNFEKQISKLDDRKRNLEVECQNQLTTIANLRQAVEDFKRNRGVMSTSPCLSGEHDVLFEQLTNFFDKNLQLEGVILQLRDENLDLKEELLIAETDYQTLHARFVNVSKQLNEERIKNKFVQPQRVFEKLNVRTRVSHRHFNDRVYEKHLKNYPRIARINMEKDNIEKFQETEERYRAIIDDLSNELVSLSNQVSMAQEKFGEDDFTSDFEAPFRELESQNDLLQKTIELMETDIKKYETTLKTNEYELEQLRSKNTSLQSLIDEKDAKYEELLNQHQAILQALQQQKALCKCAAAQSLDLDVKETAFLQSRKQDLRHIFEILDRRTEELKNVKEYSVQEKNRLSMANMELEDKLKKNEIRISSLERSLEKREKDFRDASAKIVVLSQQDGNETKHLKEIVDKMSQELSETKAIRLNRENGLAGEISTLRQTLDENYKTLSKANETIGNLERQANQYRKQSDVVNKENAILKAEIFKLRESLASQEGLERSLREQLRKTQDELQNIKHDLDQSNTVNDELDTVKRNCKSLKDSNYDLVRKYNDLVEEFNSLGEEYRKLIDVKDQLLKQIEIARNWQQDQKEQDQLISAKIYKLEHHIQTLMDDRQTLIQKINELHRDAILIGNELERYKDVYSDSLSENQLRTRLVLDSDPRIDNVDTIIRRIKRVARKLSQTRSIWQDGIRRFSD